MRISSQLFPRRKERKKKFKIKGGDEALTAKRISARSIQHKTALPMRVKLV